MNRLASNTDTETVVNWFGTYDTISGKLISTNVPFTYTSDESVEETSYVDFSISRTVDDLAQSIGLSGSLSVTYLGNSGSVKTNFIKDRVTSSATTFISVYSKYAGKRYTLTGNTVWTEDAKKRTASETYATCGDAYVTSAVLGAEFYAVYSISTETVEEQTKLIADLGAKGIVDGARINADFQSKLDEMHRSYSQSISFAQQTLGATGWDGKGSLVQFALDFAKRVRDSGGGTDIFEQQHRPLYTTLAAAGTESLREGLRTISDNAHLIAGTAEMFDKPSLTTRLVHAHANKKQTEKLLDVYQFYGASIESLKRNIDTLDDRTRDARNIYKAFQDDPTQPLSIDGFPDVRNTMPVLQFQAIEYSGYGTPYGGSPFSVRELGDYTTLIRSKCHVEKIQAKAGNDLNRLVLTYSIGGATVVKEYGGNGGTWGGEFNISPGNYITGIQLWIHRGDTPVAKVVIETATHHDFSAGTIPGNSKNYVGLPMRSDERLLGYSGRSGSAIDILYPVVVAMREPQFL